MVNAGKAKIRSLYIQDGAGKAEKERRTIEATLILEANRRQGKRDLGSTRESQSQQEKILKDYAKHEGVWFDEEQVSQGIKAPSGKETDVYISDGEKTVTNIVNYKKHSIVPDNTRVDDSETSDIRF